MISEPNQVNFACAKSTSQILWVFSLMTSGDNPNFSDAKTGRQGLEPISPTQGGEVAWSLNLHHPYDPYNAVDSLEVAARAINNIIGGEVAAATYHQRPPPQAMSYGISTLPWPSGSTSRVRTHGSQPSRRQSNRSRITLGGCTGSSSFEQTYSRDLPFPL